MPFTLFDLILLIIMLFSGFLAMLRGLSREVFSILSWVAAGGAAVYASMRYPNLLSAYISNDKAAQIGIGLIAFIIVLIIVTLITVKLSDALLDSGIGALDRSLGFIFGMARGLVMVAILHVFYAFYYDKTPFKMVEEAWSTPIVASTGEKVKNLTIDIFENFKDWQEDKEDDDY